MSYKTKESGMSDLSADDLLAQATALFLYGETLATAWLVSNEGHLLTAGHVFAQDTSLAEIRVQFADNINRIAHKIQWSFQKEKGIDFAVLKVLEMPQGRKPLPVSLARSMTGKLRLRGYGEALEDPATGMAEFVGVVDKQGSSDYRLFRLRSDELVDEGFSGGAVYSDELKAVVAIQIEAGRSRYGPLSKTVLAMPLYRIAKYWKQLETLEFISPSREANPQPTNILPPQRQPPSTLPREVQHALNECFVRHRPLILRVAPNHSSVNAQLDALYRAFLTNRLDLNTIKSVLIFFTPHSSALIELNRLLQEPTLQWLVRQGGEHIRKSYEHLVFTTITRLPFCTRCGTRASELTARFCSRCGKPMH